MDLRLLVFAILNFDTMLCAPLITKRMCNFKYCRERGHCHHSLCNVEIECHKGSIIRIRNILYGNTKSWFDTHNCRYNCEGNVAPNLTYTNKIAKFCNGQQGCSFSQWNSASYWNLDIRYSCQEKLTRTSPTLASSTGINTLKVFQTPLTTFMTTSSNTTSRTAESKLNENNVSDCPVTTVASSLTAVIVVLIIVLLGIVCIKRRKAKQVKTGRTRVQCFGRKITNQAGTNSVNDESNTADHSTEPRENFGQDYEYAAALVAINTTNESEYNTSNESAKPLKADPNYDHIPKQSTSRNKPSTKTNEEIYNTLKEKVNHNGIGNNANYDYVYKESPPDDQTYSHIKGVEYICDKPNYQVNGTDMYSHLKQ